MIANISEEQWRSFDEHGYVDIGQVASDSELEVMQRRSDEIMLGTAEVDYARVMLRAHYHDPVPTRGRHPGANLNYAMVEGLDHDAVFLRYIQTPLFWRACNHVYDRDTAIACYRAMIANKPAGDRTEVRWHQHMWTKFDRQPRLTAWTALDPATADTGCIQVIPASHRLGPINPDDPEGFLTERQIREHCRAEPTNLEMARGAVVLVHHLTLHCSGPNATEDARRLFSVNYMDASTRHLMANRRYTKVFGRRDR